MGWEARELGIATVLGATSGGLMTTVGGGPGVASLTTAGAVLGGLFGFVVGAVSVVGGHLAVESTRHWPARSERCWRARFAACSAAAVFVLVAGFWLWVLSTTGDSGSRAMGAVAVGFAAVTLGCTFLLAPHSVSRSHVGSDADDRPAQ